MWLAYSNVVGVRAFEPPHAPRDFRIIRTLRKGQMAWQFQVDVQSPSDLIGVFVRGAR